MLWRGGGGIFYYPYLEGKLKIKGPCVGGWEIPGVCVGGGVDVMELF